MTQPVESFDAQVLIAPYYHREKTLRGAAASLDAQFHGLLTDLIMQERTQGAFGECVLAAGRSKLLAPWVLFIGAGNRPDFCGQSCAKLLEKALRVCCRAGFTRVGIYFDCFQDITENLLEGLVDSQCRQAGLEDLTCRIVPIAPPGTELT